MPPTRYNADEVTRRIERLREAYEVVRVERRRDEPVETFADLRGYAEDGYIGGAYVWVVREPEQAHDLTESMPDDAFGDEDRVLLGMGRGSNHWGPAGGGLEGFDPADPGSGETYEDAAVREVAEETGVECEVHGPVTVDRLVVEDPDGADEVHLAYVVFGGRYAGGSIDVQPGELNGAAWFSELPSELHPNLDFWPEYWADRGEDA
ncbi:NUDIX hydrolase [Haloarchaeobius amylolyticus]|uniref:NUDIX hydrolase n=1 Tax=Haloarchaeobius amylolyticus TaxID=1198296 RepID=UPI0022713073|nr:NUDIX domain-containing protein [Haloarchaeobius amylolyticus]